MDFSKANNNLLCGNFNKEKDCVIFGTKNGFYVYTMYPQKKIISQKINGGVSKVCMLQRSNIVFFVGNVDSGEYSKHVLHIWDDSRKKIIGQINFKDMIQNIRVYMHYIFVSTTENLYIYNFDNLQLKHTIPITNNTSGLFKVIIDKQLLVYPNNNMIELYNWDTGETTQKKCHQHMIETFSISDDHTLLATCSKKGSLIRIFNIETLTLIKELRRGTDYVTINNITFNKDNTLLLCSSGKGTIHIFSLDNNTEQTEQTDTNIDYKVEAEVKPEVKPESEIDNDINNKRINLYSNKPVKNKKLYGIEYLKSFLPKYFNSEWSYIQIYLNQSLTYNIFSKNTNNIVSIASNGCIYIIEYSYDPIYNTSSHKIISTLKFLSDKNDPFDNRNSTIL